MDPIAVRVSGHVSASVSGSRIVVPGADYYAEEIPAAPVIAGRGDFETLSPPPLPVWRLRALQPQRGHDEVPAFDLTAEELSHYVVGGAITVLEGLCP